MKHTFWELGGPTFQEPAEFLFVRKGTFNKGNFAQHFIYMYGTGI